MTQLPLHCLVFDFDNILVDNSSIDSAEHLSFDAVRKGLIGDQEGYFVEQYIQNEIYNRISLKLWLGERIILSASNMKKFERIKFTNAATELGVSIYYVINNKITDKDVIAGDGIAEVINNDISKIDIVKKLLPSEVGDYIRQNFKGITVVGDVHGQLELMKMAINWAKSRNNLIIFLGDILDFGPKSLECISEIYPLVCRNQAILIIGNHERKLFKWLNKASNKDIKIFLSDANKKTIEQIKKMKQEDKIKWEAKFRTLMQLGFLHLNIEDNFFFAHAAYSKDMALYDSRTLPVELERIALFGKIVKETNTQDKKPMLDYSWINDIFENEVVFVGHESKNFFLPVIEKSDAGGLTYFMDTGAGKGGNLTSLDIVLKENKFIIQNFNHWQWKNEWTC